MLCYIELNKGFSKIIFYSLIKENMHILVVDLVSRANIFYLTEFN